MGVGDKNVLYKSALDIGKNSWWTDRWTKNINLTKTLFPGLLIANKKNIITFSTFEVAKAAIKNLQNLLLCVSK